MHLKAINRHQRGIRIHLKSILDDLDDEDDTDDDPADDPALPEGDGPDEDMGKAFLVELQKLVAQAETLAST
jgi:hypothetical protein